jgi:integrase
VPRVGRNRTKNKRLAKGWTPIGRVMYFVPTNAEDTAIVAAATGGKKSLRLGLIAQPDECLRTFVTTVTERRVATAIAGTVGELVIMARRDILPIIASAKTKAERERHWRGLEKLFGTKRYARNVYEASRDPSRYFVTTDVQAHIDSCAETRPVSANREVDSWSLIFEWARTRWGRTEYNPCRGVFKNEEEPRDVLPAHEDLYRGSRQGDDGPSPRGIYRQLSPPGRFILNMYRYYGRRRGETLRLTLADVQHPDGIHMLRGKERQRKGSARKAARKPRLLIIPWDQRNKRMVARALRWRAAKMREALPTTAFLVNREGKPFSDTAAKSEWRRGMIRSGQHGQFTQHDVRATRASTLPLDVAQGVLAQEDRRSTLIYTRGPKIIDLKGHK